MDMEVDTSAFSHASYSLKKHCANIESLTAFFLKKLSIAGQEFDTDNYDNTVKAAEDVKREVTDFSYRVDALNKDLERLESIVNEYANGGYGR